QLGTGGREEQEHEQRPQREEKRRREARAGAAQPCQPRGKDREDEREHPHEEDRHEIPGGMLAVVNRGGEALKVLLHEKETREFRIAHRDRDEPRHGDGEKERYAPRKLEPAEQRPIASDE